MKVRIGSPDERALKLANELRRRVKKRAAKLKEQQPADAEQSEQHERARAAVKAVNRRLKDAISILEIRRAAFSRVVQQLSVTSEG
jgi:hypothetical protein